MENSVPAWVSAITLLIGGGVGAWFLNIYNARNKNNLDTTKQKDDSTMANDKQKSELRISENEQAFKLYKDLLELLRMDVSKMTLDMAKLDEERIHYREENATLKAENRAMAKEIEILSSPKK